MKVLKIIRNYVLYCGIEKDEYNAIKKDAYVSNYDVWRVLHCLMLAAFAFLFLLSTFFELMAPNRIYYLIEFVYSLGATCLILFVLKKDSILAQFLIYLSISMLFLFGALIAQNHPELPSTTFIVMLLITPMFMIDKPYFMAIELTAASAIFLVWMHGVKPDDVWRIDCSNIIIFCLVGIFLHIIANSLRIKEFVLTRRINIQKDTDDLTGLKNKGCVTRQINLYMTDESKDKGIMILLDINHFKSINDTYGHDLGDSIIIQFGKMLTDVFNKNEIVGRFGGDEFVVFIKDTDSKDDACDAALRIINGSKKIKLPDGEREITSGIGIALYHGKEKNYSEIFKKADVALYKTKADRTVKFSINENTEEE